MKEMWVTAYCGSRYEVSNLGRVRSLDWVDARGTFRKGANKKIYINSGYYRVSMRNNGKSKVFFVHHLVYYSFNGGAPNGNKLVIDHIDGNPLNNRLDNLQKISQHENVLKGETIKYDLPKYVTASPYNYDRSKLRYYYQPVINGKSTVLKNSIHLEKVLAFKEEYELNISKNEQTDS